MQNVCFPFSQYKTATELTEYTFSQPDVRSTYKRYKASDFALKILGREEYLMDVVPFIQYKVCVCICLLYACVCVYLHVHVQMYVCVCVYLHVCVCLCLSICVSVYVCVCICLCVYMYMYVSVSV